METKSIEQSDEQRNKLNCKVFLKDIMLNKKLLLDTSSRCNLNKINLSDEKRIVLVEEDDAESGETMDNGDAIKMTDDDTKKQLPVEQNNDVSMLEEQQSAEANK